MAKIDKLMLFLTKFGSNLNCFAFLRQTQPNRIDLKISPQITNMEIFPNKFPKFPGPEFNRTLFAYPLKKLSSLNGFTLHLKNMKRVISNYYHIFNCNKSSLNLHVSNLFKNQGRNVLQCDFRNFKSTPILSAEKKESEVVEVIYQAPQMNMVKRVRRSTLSIGAMAIIAQPFLISKLLTAQEPFSLYMAEGGTSILLIVPILFHLFTRGYVYEILYDDVKKTYIAKLNNFFLRPQYVSFKIEDVKPAESMFTSFYVKGKPLIVFEESFVDVSHFIKMKSFDKPIDIKLETLKNELPKNK